jgi:hypothetical protein
MSVGVIRIGPTAVLRSIGAVALSASRALLNAGVIPSHQHDAARSFQFCEPKTEVQIVDATHLSRDKKIPKKIQEKNVTDPSDETGGRQNPPNVFMSTAHMKLPIRLQPGWSAGSLTAGFYDLETQ